jgi:phage gpG-like protein
MADDTRMSRATFTMTKNDISPALARLAASARHPRKVFLAMGNVFKSITVGNFNSAGLQYRPIPWVPKKDGTPATLKKTGLLWKSFNLEVTDQYARLSNPTPYAAVHQFGSADYHSGDVILEHHETATGSITKLSGARKQNIPPRPFYPVENGRLTPAAEKLIAAAGEKALMRDAGL